MKTTERDFWTITEAAKRLGVSRQRMHQIIDEMKAKTMELSPKLHLISREELARIEQKRNSQN